jgi:hypothetical protein
MHAQRHTKTRTCLTYPQHILLRRTNTLTNNIDACTHTYTETAATLPPLRNTAQNFEFDKPQGYEASILEGSEYDGSEEAEASGTGRGGGLDSPNRVPLFQVCVCVSVCVSLCVCV